MLKAWEEFEAARVAVSRCTDLAEFEKTKQWIDLRSYLNLHELMAVGVNQKVLDDTVCFEFWNGELHRAYRDCEHAIKYIQAQPGEGSTYCELVRLHGTWSRKRVARSGV